MLLTRSDGDAISRRYGATAAGEWQRLLQHLDYAEDFALLVLVVPDLDGARLCRNELARVLAQDGKQLLAFDAETPEALRAHAAELLEQPIAELVGACWLAGVAPQSADEFPKWRAAWRRALEGLNQQRNPLRRHVPCRLVIAVAPWVIPLFRDVAPDLWSVRSQVVRIEPEPGRMRDGIESSIEMALDRRMPDSGSAPDPELAHREVERLRGVSGRERELGAMLIREGRGLRGRGDFAEAEAALREAADVLNAIGDKFGSAAAQAWLGRPLLALSRAAEAEVNRAGYPGGSDP